MPHAVRDDDIADVLQCVVPLVVAHTWMNSGLCIVPMKSLGRILQHKGIILCKVQEDKELIHLKSLLDLCLEIALSFRDEIVLQEDIQFVTSTKSSAFFTIVSKIDLSVDTHCLYCTSSTISLSNSAFNCSFKVDLLGHCAHSPM